MVFIRILFCAFFLVLGAFALAGAEIPQLPDVSKWIAGKTEHINFMIERKNIVYTVYLGDKTEFQNPDDCDEYVLVFRRYIPLVIEKAVNVKKRGDITYISAYDQKIKNEAFEQRQQNSDIFAYSAYRKGTDDKMGIISRIDIQKELAGSWLLDQDGKWGFFARYPIREQIVSEWAVYDPKTNIQVGVNFLIPAVQHVLMFDQRLVKPAKEKKK